MYAMYWYNDNKSIWDLAIFLIEIDEINTADQLLYYLYHPDKYTDVWTIYQRQIIGHEQNELT